MINFKFKIGDYVVLTEAPDSINAYGFAEDYSVGVVKDITVMPGRTTYVIYLLWGTHYVNEAPYESIYTTSDKRLKLASMRDIVNARKAREIWLNSSGSSFPPAR